MDLKTVPEEFLIKELNRRVKCKAIKTRRNYLFIGTSFPFSSTSFFSER